MRELSTKIGSLITEYRATHLERISYSDVRHLWATVKPSLGKSHKPISLAEMYGDNFADLDCINQYFAGIATDPNYDFDEIQRIKRAASDKNTQSGPITSEYEVYRMLSSLKKTSPGPDGVPYRAYKHCVSRGRHLYWSGRPSRWASAHILVQDVLSHVGSRFVGLHVHDNAAAEADGVVIGDPLRSATPDHVAGASVVVVASPRRRRAT